MELRDLCLQGLDLLRQLGERTFAFVAEALTPKHFDPLASLKRVLDRAGPAAIKLLIFDLECPHASLDLGANVMLQKV